MEVLLSSLLLYPLKSGVAVDLKTALVEHDGLKGDRRIMVVAEDGVFLTSRQFPDLLKVHCSLEGDAVVLSAIGKTEVRFPRLVSEISGYLRVTIWKDNIQALDAGDQAASWISDFLGHRCRLVFQGSETARRLHDRPGLVNLADTAPLLLIGQTSLANLNEHLDVPVEMARFRPNLVVSGTGPFDEDEWGIVQIGEIRFEAIGACSRCKVTTLDPISSLPRSDNEPLATLSKRRRGVDGEAYFGQFLRPLTFGRLHIGDPVTVLSRKTGPKLHPAPATARIVKESTFLQQTGGPFNLACVGITEETPEISTFRFRVEGGIWANYQPGQFLTLLLDIDGEPIKRSYTISSSPTRPHHLSITTKRVQGGQISNWLHDNLRVGSAVKATAPSGQFHLGRVGDSTKLLMLSAGSGITPMISMVRAIADLDLPYNVVFHHSCRTFGDMPFREELSSLQRILADRLAVTCNLTGKQDPRDGTSDIWAGRVDVKMLASVCPDIADRTTLCCGPNEFRKAARLIHAGLAPNAKFLEESFGAIVKQGKVDKPEPYKVTFTKSGKSIDGVGTQTLLELAKEVGVSIPSECEAGICGSCRCRIANGSWVFSQRCADVERLALSDAEKADNFVLACTTRPLGAVEVEI